MTDKKTETPAHREVRHPRKGGRHVIEPSKPKSSAKKDAKAETKPSAD